MGAATACKGWVHRGCVAAGLAMACGGDDGGADEGATTASSTTATSSGPGTGNGGETGETGGVGALRGIVTFSLYPAGPQTPADVLGLAGGFRDTGFDDVDDFFAVYALGQTFPLPPTDLDVLEHNDVPIPYDWGTADQWLSAGGGLELHPTAQDQAAPAVACLLLIDGDYPIYAATDSPNQDPTCAPMAVAWQPQSSYDVVMYGGMAFDDTRVEGAVSTPDAVVVTAPDPDAFNLAVDRTDPLSVAWSGQTQDGDRLVIRLWDVFGKLVTVRALDDGAFSIPAADLGMLAEGPATLTVARERLAVVQLARLDDGTAAGEVKVVTRHEVRAFLDLF